MTKGHEIWARNWGGDGHTYYLDDDEGFVDVQRSKRIKHTLTNRVQSQS